MTTSLRLVIYLCLSLCCSLPLVAQTPTGALPPTKANKSATLTIVVAPTEQGMRFTVLGAADKLRLEVFDASGNALLDTGFHLGNLLDWAATDGQGQVLADGTYTCIVTAHDIAGSLRVKQGSVTVQAGRALLELPDAGALMGDKQPAAEQALTTLKDDA